MFKKDFDLFEKYYSFSDETTAQTESLSINELQETFLTETGIEEVDLRGKEIYNYIINNESLLSKISLLSKEQLNSDEGIFLRNYSNLYIKNNLLKEENFPTVVDLFSGAGGLSFGFTDAQYKILLANDHEESAMETYLFNHPTLSSKFGLTEDIEDVIKSNKLDILKENHEVDVVIGGPPCQGFSNANRQRLIDDPRNRLYKEFIHAVDILQPKFIVMENVRGMHKVANQVKEDFENIGYSVDFHLYNVKDFGIPQNRERLIFIGNRIGANNKKIHNDIALNAFQPIEYVLKDALYGLPNLIANPKKNNTNGESDDYGYTISRYNLQNNDYINWINNGRKINDLLNHKARYNNDRDIEIYSLLNPGDDSTDEKIAHIMPYASRNHIFKDKYYKLDEERVSKAITAHMKFDCNMYIHPNQARGLTPREAARIQTFPDDYYFKGAYTKTYMQIGNSVPPKFSKMIAKSIKKLLD